MYDVNSFLRDFYLFSDKTAITYKNLNIPYSELACKIEKWSETLKEVKSGQIVGLEGDFTPVSISILFALMGKNAIIVPLDVKQKGKNDRKYEIAQLDQLITVDDENTVIKKTGSPHGEAKHPLFQEIIRRGVSGLVLFTSGSSGEPKAAVHDLSVLLDKFGVKRAALKTLNFLLFDHWGGLNTLFHILSNGGAVITLEERTPDYVCDLIEKHQIELLPASPSFLNLLVLSRAYENRNLDSLKIISYGTEPMPENLLKHLNNLFPNVSLRQTYGLIELGVLRAKSENNQSLWVKIGGEGYQTRVVDGILQIKAESAMLGYLNAPSPFTEDGWFITGDSVEVKGEYLRILGRKSEIINVGGEKVFPQEVENVIMELDNVLSVTVYGEKNPVVGNIVCAKIQLKKEEDQKLFSAKVKKICNEQLARFKVPVKIVYSAEDQVNSRFKKERYRSK